MFITTRGLSGLSGGSSHSQRMNEWQNAQNARFKTAIQSSDANTLAILMVATPWNNATLATAQQTFSNPAKAAQAFGILSNNADYKALSPAQQQALVLSVQQAMGIAPPVATGGMMQPMYLPPAQPDNTMLYVLGGLAVLGTVGAAVYFNQKK